MYLLDGICKVFNGRTIAVRELDLKIRRGEWVALIGPSGAGKTTLFRLLNFTIPPTSGTLLFDGLDNRHLSGRRLREVRRRIGTIYQQHNLVPRLQVVHNVLSGRLGTWPVWQAVRSLIRPVEVDLAADALRQVGIADKLYERTETLSGGQQQRVAIARLLVQDPEVILADEPVSSVDPALAAGIVKLLIELSQTYHKTLLMNLHSVDLALAYFPRVIGLKDGMISFDLPTAAVTDEHLTALYAGSQTEVAGEEIFSRAERSFARSCQPRLTN
ncbi:ABC transporter ATP-binding protein [Candidatus Methylomirabilis lanthanidiphila]|uniref:ABC transporter ATP-binding protein n=1 Tax=Candidatus Methylomirabilis lanthanidiphila TaxID=2211376 RepID=A0A564ZI20_9BACT|nr:phosphonate ABC transporter ATP-binding protein [Candidatus Methylomirabilis lanthanidiphila]VUZ84557.1 ABC transporter ATP-binding protein [Candidatus Methylomirabilis lanthanidiphila]